VRPGVTHIYHRGHFLENFVDLDLKRSFVGKNEFLEPFLKPNLTSLGQKSWELNQELK
jgi:hypothetical protein